jgi:type I restriction enzyme M protein
MVKKNGKDKEVQDGWIGHIIPFELVQNSLLKEQSDALNEKNLILSEISSEYDEILESLSEEDKESDAVNEDKKGFVSKEVKKMAKEIRNNLKKGIKYDEDSLGFKLVKVEDLYNKEKLLKSEIKKDTELLIKASKETIENLSDEQVYEMLELKWINPLVTELKKLTNDEFNKLTDKIKILSEKYTTTYFDLEKEIKETEHSLSEMIDDLVGSEYDMKALKAFQDLLDGE